MTVRSLSATPFALREWVAITLIMLSLTAGLGWFTGLGRIDQTIYDQFILNTGRVARDDIIIVAIDDSSLAEIGRWPWPRNTHAELLRIINKADPIAIGLDITFSEPEISNPDQPSGDLALAEVLSENNRTVLPLVLANNGNGLIGVGPIPSLSKAALSLGHINIALDPDGVMRSVFLREGQNGLWWPHFSVAISDPLHKFSDAPDAILPLPGERNGNNQKSPTTTTNSSDLWQRDYRMHIPFAGGSGHFKAVPYGAVLRGEVPAGFFTHKYVLIGATAIGMADSFPTPVSGKSGVMSGIEINANILASLLDGKSISIASPMTTSLFSALPVLIVMLGYLLLSPRRSLILTGLAIVVTFVASFAAFSRGLWLAPSAALICLVAAYPLWSWRRLEAAITYLGQEFIRLDKEPHLLPESREPKKTDHIEDVLEQRINAVKNAARRVRDLGQFVSDSLNSLPDATLVTSIEGQVLLSNKHANDYFASIGTVQIVDALLPYLFAKLTAPHPLDQAANAQFSWWNLLDLKHTATLANGIEVRDENGRDLLIKSAPCHSAGNILTGWIVSVIDISTIRSAERSRDETLRFLSHDMRAPQASILALLELQQEADSALPQDEFYARVEKATRKTLGLADNFVQLARAESQEYRLEEVDFQDVLFDATDEMWSLAKAKHIELATHVEEGEYPVRVDRALLARALINLISNAIKYSPENTRISCAIRHNADPLHPQVICDIVDQGYGIAAVDQAKLFRRFQRVHHPNQVRQDGIGLGLVFVKTVVERHRGQISFHSSVNIGSTFSIVMPCDEG
ncbi:MAG: CHASE2 domain-containing protein [Pseudomonadota bacterium]